MFIRSLQVVAAFGVSVSGALSVHKGKDYAPRLQHRRSNVNVNKLKIYLTLF